MKLIDVDRLKEKMATTLDVLKHIFPPGEQEIHLISAFDTVRQMADDCPTIDAVPVVRCKDCKHYWKNTDGESVPVCLASPKDDAFCSEGRRKDDAAK